MRKKIVAANWKMNKLFSEGIQLVADILVRVRDVRSENTIVIFPPSIHLSSIGKIIENQHHIKLGAQNCHFEDQGAFTGEISALMLSSLGVEYVIIGHSERRQLFNDSNEIVTKKVNAVISNGLKVIFCCGEPLDVRKQGGHKDYIKNQIRESLFNLSAKELHYVIIAYEPIWAIGTGETATPEQAQEMHQYIRSLIAEKFSKEEANSISIIYGGSVKPDNAQSIFSQSDIDGGLIGGASLVADDFVKIVKSLP